MSIASATPAQAQSAAPESALAEARSALDRARFDQAKRRADALLKRTDLEPRTRNAALELSAIIDTAARRERAAQTTLATLFARDPLHPRRVTDPGPTVEAAFARAQGRRAQPLSVAFSAHPARKADGTLTLSLRMIRGTDAVQSLHVRVLLEDDGEFVDISAPLGLRDRLSLNLPVPMSFVGPLPLMIEARSPGGFVLGRIGTEAEPATLQVTPVPRTPAPHVSCRRESEPLPLRRAWWLWTSLSIVVAGIALSAGYIAH